MSSYCIATQQEYINNIQIKYLEYPKVRSSHRILLHFLLLKATLRICYDIRCMRKLHNEVSRAKVSLPLSQEKQDLHDEAQDALEKKLSELAKIIKYSQRHSAPMYFVNKLIELEDALSDILFFLLATSDSELQELSTQLQRKLENEVNA